MKVTILYSELAEYTLACLKELASKGVSIQLFYWPINPEAPFNFDMSFCSQSISRDTIDQVDLLQMVADFKPDLLMCSGWMDRDYVKVCSHWYGKIPTVLTMDNHWSGGGKQNLARLVAPFTIRKAFSHAFVPGEVQKQYAVKLGFKEHEIRTGFYTADTNKFLAYFKERIAVEKDERPLRFLYLGRYIHHKGIFDMWNAFRELKKGEPNIELWCVGTGDQYDNKDESEGIRHFGFVQPSELLPILKQCDVYILPSHFEPWGVSVQEMAISGMPLILSSAIGSKEAFLNEGINGYEFVTANGDDLLKAMERFVGKSNEELIEMGAKSHELGMSNSPAQWAQTLISILDGRSE